MEKRTGVLADIFQTSFLPHYAQRVIVPPRGLELERKQNGSVHCRTGARLFARGIGPLGGLFQQPDATNNLFEAWLFCALLAEQEVIPQTAKGL